MDINLLPLELLQQILSHLSYDELMVASLVCHRWNQASGMFIVRNGQFRITEQAVDNLDVIRNSTRNYQMIAFFRMDDWHKLHAAVSECIRRFPNARKLYLAGILQDYLDRFYRAFRDWVGQFESLRVSLDDRFDDHFLCGPEDYVLTLPNLKQLHWAECLYGHGQKTVTIDAPKLESVYIDDSLDASAVVKIAHCDRIKHIRCMFYTKHFDDTFVGNICNVETLLLSVIYCNCDISYLVNMHQLRYLKLSFGSAKNSLQEVEAMQNSKQLKVLSIIIQDSNSEKGRLNLKKVLSNFKNLETLELCRVHLKAKESIQADKMVLLKLRHVTCSNSILSLIAPKLRTLSLSVNILRKLQLSENEHLVDLYLDLESSNLKESLEQIICPFIQKHKNLKNLTLMRDGYQENPILDYAIYDRIAQGVEHLELHRFDVSIDFFRMLSEWKSLKSIKLVACSINCCSSRITTTETPNDVVQLPGVKRMILDCVKLRGTSKTDFPLLISGVSQVFCKWISSTLFFSTNKFIHNESKFEPFSCDTIEPI